MKLIKKITPVGGVRKTPLEILKAAREVLAEDGRWVQGALVCPVVTAGDMVEQDITEDAWQQVTDDILRNGLCGKGWGMCAMGGLALTAGLNAIVEDEAYRYDPDTGGYGYADVKRLTSLVTEDGSVAYEELENAIPKVRQQRYIEAGKALDAAAMELFDKENVVMVNDDENWVGDQPHPEKALENVIACFDRAIEMLEEGK